MNSPPDRSLQKGFSYTAIALYTDPMYMFCCIWTRSAGSCGLKVMRAAVGGGAVTMTFVACT